MEQEEDQVSFVMDDGEEIIDAGSETDDSSSSAPVLPDYYEEFTRNGMLKLGEENPYYGAVKTEFLTGMNELAKDTAVVAIHKNIGGPGMKARYTAFKTSIDVLRQRRGDVNMRHAWYGGTISDIRDIISYGFSRYNGQTHGLGVYLSTPKFIPEAFPCTNEDENGIRHMLLCFVLLGKMELIPQGSKQVYPTSVEFDSGVDNLQEPSRLVVWRCFMNSHIFPAFIVSFKAPSFSIDMLKNQIIEVRSHGQSLSLDMLSPILVKVFGPAKSGSILKSLGQYRKSEISQEQMIQKLKQIIGNNPMFDSIIRASGGKPAVGAPNSQG